ncbi:MAG: hypothetical protein WAV76_10685 [Bacteroidota bacterium]
MNIVKKVHSYSQWNNNKGDVSLDSLLLRWTIEREQELDMILC